ncbi:uncharacterized protein LOC141629635 [Silene latifolia]|uniref:uncharacterized protein LOC141629635 n=1 Tax=Silene latifolia TaxID=37657 RepID=UPI003D78320F
MMKWICKLLFRPNSIWVQWTKAYLLKGSNIWQASHSVSYSWYWNNVIKMKDLLISRAGSQGQALQWLLACSGPNSFSSALMYKLIRTHTSLVPWWQLVHDSACVPKHSFIGMLVMDNKLPTVDNLVHRGLHMVNRCVLCCTQEENAMHLFFHCSYSQAVWAQIAEWLGVCSSADLQTVLSWFQSHVRGTLGRARKMRAGLLASLYFLWKERNARIF